MHEVAKCALCGYSPMHLIRDGIDKISCCGMMCDVLRWNYVQRSILSEKELSISVKVLEAALNRLVSVAERCDSWESFPGTEIEAANEALEVLK